MSEVVRPHDPIPWVPGESPLVVSAQPCDPGWEPAPDALDVLKARGRLRRPSVGLT